VEIRNWKLEIGNWKLEIGNWKLETDKTEKTAGLARILSFGRRKTAVQVIRKKSVHGICLMRKPTGTIQNPNLNLWAKRNTQAAEIGFWNWTL